MNHVISRNSSFMSLFFQSTSPRGKFELLTPFRQCYFILCGNNFSSCLFISSDTYAQTSSCQQPCQNGGQCTSTQSGQFCVCPVDFTGTMCETSIDDCLFPTQNQCQHNSQCTDGVGNYSCVCLSGWEGRFCEKVCMMIIIIIELRVDEHRQSCCS